MYLLKQKKIYKAQYNSRLSKGELFKANTELTNLQTRLGDLGEWSGRIDEDKEKHSEIKNRLLARINAKKVIISRFQTEVEENRIKLEELESGKLNDELQEEFDTKKQEKTERREKRYAKNDAKKVINKEKSQTFYQTSIKASRTSRFKVKDMNRAFKYFERVSNNLPNYIHNKLKDMPENECYLWKHVRFYGLRPVKPPYTLKKIYECRGPDKTLIHVKQNGDWNKIMEYNKRKYSNKKPTFSFGGKNFF